ncbi:hypothetical protein SAMN05421505_12410 [Sinosporangium album]|uniref:Uncharacterized protein n=1 Tax=Sinosporangium album TaxID=504805 RepID=A0A1G8FMW5_9ACTN|nr:hypothetical protein SAMN05421505_12410 [Sinosporangium album]
MRVSLHMRFEIHSTMREVSAYRPIVMGWSGAVRRRGAFDKLRFVPHHGFAGVLALDDAKNGRYIHV